MPKVLISSYTDLEKCLLEKSELEIERRLFITLFITLGVLHRQLKSGLFLIEALVTGMSV
jgi:hypothetical protein